jgi:hypothetical protein
MARGKHPFIIQTQEKRERIPQKDKAQNRQDATVEWFVRLRGVDMRIEGRVERVVQVQGETGSVGVLQVIVQRGGRGAGRVDRVGDGLATVVGQREVVFVHGGAASVCGMEYNPRGEERNANWTRFGC